MQKLVEINTQSFNIMVDSTKKDDLSYGIIYESEYVNSLVKEGWHIQNIVSANNGFYLILFET